MYNPKWFTKPMPGVKLNKAHPLNRGLIGYWVLNEGSGTRANDITGNNNAGTLTNFALSGATSNWVGTPQGGGLSFDGVNDYISVGSGSKMVPPAITVSQWVKILSYTAFGVMYGNATSGTRYFKSLIIQSTGRHQVYLFASGAVSALSVSSEILALNRWYHIVTTYDSASGIRTYINGRNDQITSANGVIPDTSGDTQIGAAATDGQYFNGIIDETRLYNRALTQYEVQTLYSQPHIDFIDNKSWINPTLYGLGAWKGTKLVAGATGTLTANSANDMVEAGMTLAFKKNCS